jgi:Family of unknown function (DUF6011)
MTDRDKMAAVERLMKLMPSVPANRLDFAKSLVSQYETKGFLSERQMEWVCKIADEAEGDGVVTPDLKVPKIRDAMDTALGNGMKKPMLLSKGVKVYPSANQRGVLYVKLEGDYAGKILPDGSLRAANGYRVSDIATALSDLERDPEEAALRYSREFGICSCCGAKLTNAESIRLGIGPICRSNFGWG